MKNKTKKIISSTFAIILIVLIQAIGITYAKYISSENATGHAEVAKWSFEIVKDGEETKNIKLVDTSNNETLVNGKIAPGTSGEIILELDATGSEVDLDYTVEFLNEQNKPSNLKFLGGNQKYESLDEWGKIEGKIKYNDVTKVKSIVIPWVWEYETGGYVAEIAANNEIDTQEANTITEYTFDVLVTATQCE